MRWRTTEIGEVSMNLISEKEAAFFSSWAKEKKDEKCFAEIEKEKSSYYIDRDSEETYIMEYSFRNMEELKKLLRQYGTPDQEPELLKALTIAICRNGPGSVQSSMNCGKKQGQGCLAEDKEKILPEYTYVF